MRAFTIKVAPVFKVEEETVFTHNNSETVSYGGVRMDSDSGFTHKTVRRETDEVVAYRLDMYYNEEKELYASINEAMNKIEIAHTISKGFFKVEVPEYAEVPASKFCVRDTKFRNSISLQLPLDCGLEVDLFLMPIHSGMRGWYIKDGIINSNTTIKVGKYKDSFEKRGVETPEGISVPKVTMASIEKAIVNSKDISYIQTPDGELDERYSFQEEKEKEIVKEKSFTPATNNPFEGLAGLLK